MTRWRRKPEEPPPGHAKFWRYVPWGTSSWYYSNQPVEINQQWLVTDTRRNIRGVEPKVTNSYPDVRRSHAGRSRSSKFRGFSDLRSLQMRRDGDVCIKVKMGSGALIRFDPRKKEVAGLQERQTENDVKMEDSIQKWRKQVNMLLRMPLTPSGPRSTRFFRLTERGISMGF